LINRVLGRASLFERWKNRAAHETQQKRSEAPRKTAPTPPKELSQLSIAVMISQFDRLFFQTRAFTALGPPLEVHKFRDLLFGMGMSREILDRCDHSYHWHFGSLLPALNDGSFFYGAWQISKTVAVNNGQTVLHGLATALCGILEQHPELRDSEAEYLAHVLRKDGFHFLGGRLIETSQDVVSEAEEISAVQSLIKLSVHDKKEILLHHFSSGPQLFNSGHYHASVNEWRSFLEETLRGIWRLTRERRSEFTTHAATPGAKDLFKFLRQAAFFNDDEQLAFSSTWAFLCSGGHPGIPDRADAHLSMVLALTFGQAALLKLQTWSEGGFVSF
jgi:hypothetical protein